MISKSSFYYFSYFIIVLGLFISGYLLFNHNALISGKPLETDLCSAVFGKGCDAAALSDVSQFMKIPMGGWGIIYLAFIGCYILFSQLFFKKDNDEVIQLAFWISFVGIFFSMFYVVLMLLNPILFCPFCAVFHVLNFTLFFLIKKLTGKSFLELFKGLMNALGIIFLARSINNKFNTWKWLAVFFPLILGLSIYQWALMEGLNIRIEKLSSYDPLIELQKFEARKVWNIEILPEDPILGSKDAPVSLVVFSDFQCSICELFAANFEQLIKYNKGKLNIIFKSFPLSSKCNSLLTSDMHPLACNAARAAEAAHQQGEFWEYHDIVFQRSINKNSSEEMFFEIAQSLKLDMKKFKMDYNSKDCQDKIKSDVNEGLRLEIDGTPTVFLNGRKIRVLSESNINFLVKYLAH